MSTVLVTGADGFIGRHALPLLLERGFEVHATSLRPDAPSGDGVSWHAADLLLPEDVQRLFERVRPSHLLHFAWYAVPGRFWTSAENHRWVRATLDVLERFAANGGRRVVAAGSCAEYDWSAGVCAEGSTPLRPSTTYGLCKRVTGELLGSFAGTHGLSAAWGRVFHLHGPGEQPPRLVPSVIEALLRGEPALCSHGEQIRDFLHVEEVADAFVALLASDVTGAVNIASGVPVRIREVVAHLAASLGADDLVRLGALPAAESDPPVLLADVRRLRDEVGWRPRYSPTEGLDRTIQWWVESRVHA